MHVSSVMFHHSVIDILTTFNKDKAHNVFQWNWKNVWQGTETIGLLGQLNDPKSSMLRRNIPTWPSCDKHSTIKEENT